MFEAINRGLDNPGIDKLLTFWNEKINKNLSKFHVNKNILEAIDEVDKRIQKIEEQFEKKDEPEKEEKNEIEEKDSEEENDEKDEKELKRKQMIAMHNEGKTKTTYRFPLGSSTNSQFLFNTPFMSEAFQNVIKESNEEDENKDNIIDSLDKATFIYKTEELDKNVISIVRYKETIIGYIDLDCLLQRIAMETPIFLNEDMNDYLLEGLCLQHSNFILSDILIKKIISCFKYNYSRYLENENDPKKQEEEEFSRVRTENISVAYQNKNDKKNKRVFIGPIDEIGKMENKLELFKDTEKRIPYGLINLIIIYINNYKKYSLSNIDLTVASKIIELLDNGLKIVEIKNIYENEISKSRVFLKDMIANTLEPQIQNKKIPFETIYKKDKNDGKFMLDIFSFSSKEIATELTRISNYLFSKITPKEFFKGLFTKKDKEKTSPNICKVVDRFNTLSFWVIEEVLSYDYASDRAKVIEKFIHIANELKTLNNYNDCMSIVSALGQMIITKLNKSWKKVSSKNMTLLHKIKKLLNFQNNYKNIRDEIAKCLENGKPFLPFLGYYTKRICFLEESGPYVKSGLINVDKISQVEQILSEFYDKNKVKYELEIKEDVKNKLLIFQCLDPCNEIELEEEGNNIEPKFILCKKTRNKRMTNTEKKFKENYNKNYII